ncbi:MAG: TIGR00282 family metallophosphoesterase [Candidatus Latescibacteria bacterium]|nr:TIGR00282 family metallophosphoesterase [Candidatus Latescibacterota bacterium]
MPSKKILFLGDICSEVGRQAVINNLAQIKQEQDIFFTIAEAENVANGYGITPKLANELFDAGVDCITLGDHFLDRKDIVTMLVAEQRMLRPANFHNDVPGHGYAVYAKDEIKIGVLSLLGRVYLKPIDCPFQTAVNAIEKIKEQTPVIIVDFHAEATAEKKAMGWFLDNKATAVIGTHTHVQTADEQILNNGTAYITDAGMCGAMDSVLGMRIDLSVKKLMYNIPLRLEAAKNNVHIQGVMITVDTATGKALQIERFDQQVIEPKTAVE